MTTRFASAADMMSRVLGMPDYAFARIGHPVSSATDEGLREVGFGVQEGQPMSDWFADWIAGHRTPEGAESFDTLRHQLAGAVLAIAVAGTLAHRSQRTHSTVGFKLTSFINYHFAWSFFCSCQK